MHQRMCFPVLFYFKLLFFKVLLDYSLKSQCCTYISLKFLIFISISIFVQNFLYVQENMLRRKESILIDWPLILYISYQFKEYNCYICFEICTKFNQIYNNFLKMLKIFFHIFDKKKI